MPTNDYFRCPACRAKLAFGKRPKARVRCPRCGHEFDYDARSTGSESVAQKSAKPRADAPPAASAQEDLGGTAAFGLALQEATGGARRPEHSDAEDDADVLEAEADEAPEDAEADDSEYGPATAPLRPRMVAAPVEPEPVPATQPPLSKRLKKWYKRSSLSNPATGGWQIAAGYSGIWVVVLLSLLFMWFRHLSSEASSDKGSSYATVYKDSSSNLSNFTVTGALSLGTLFCLPIPYGLWTGSPIGRYAWLFVRAVGYIGCLVVLPGLLSQSSEAVKIVLMALLVMAAIGNLAGCFLLTTWEGSVGRMLFGIVLIAGSELFLLVLLLKTGMPGQHA
jgi:hypothetical protein